MQIIRKIITTKNKAFNRKAIERWESLKHRMTMARKALGLNIVPIDSSQDEQPVRARVRNETVAFATLDLGATIAAAGQQPQQAQQAARPRPAEENRELSDITRRVTNYVTQARNELKILKQQPEFLQEIHLKGDKEWKIFPEYFNDETGKTEYGETDGSSYIEDKTNLNKFTGDKGRFRFNGKPTIFTIDMKVPYTKDANMKVKDAVKKAEEHALMVLRDHRKTRKAIPFIEKELPRGSALLKGMPEEFIPTYKAYASGGYGGVSEDGRFGHDKYIIHMEEGTFVKLAQIGKLRRVFEAKKPRTKEHHVGVEIEFVSKFNKYELAQLLFNNNVHDFVQLIQDGSLRPEKEYKYCHEITILAPEAMIHMVIQRVLKAINHKDGSRVNKRCGLHVHLDMRNRNHQLSYSNLLRAQTMMFAMNPRSRLDGTQSDSKKDVAYARRMEIEDIQEAIRDMSSRSGSLEHRYVSVNPLALERHQTIEVRVHSGSLNFEKISNWIKMLTAIVNKTDKVDKEFTTPESFCEYYKLDDVLGYMKERIAKFKDKAGRHITVDEVA